MPPPPLPANPAPKRESFTDYGDWINPMVVKELRQGMRKNWFTIVFIIVQVLLVGFLGIQLLALQSNVMTDIGSAFDGMFWGVLGILLVLIMPMRGLAAIAEEQKANTMEMVQVTHLDSTRIVYGKWVSLICQMLLLVTAVLPYAVLRYFFGGVDIVANLATIGGMVLGSMLISAIAVFFSTLPQYARALPVAMIVIGAQAGATFLFSPFGRMSGASFPSGWAALFAVATIVPFMLALTASRIAPLAENHAVTIRGIALASGFVSLLMVLITASGVWFFPILPVLLWATIESLTERSSEFPALYRPWAIRGMIGKLAGRLFYPGWASGLIFAFVVVALGTLIVLALSPRAAGVHWDMNLGISAIFFGALVTPVMLLIHLPMVKRWGGLYFLIQLVGILWFSAVRMIFSQGKHEGAVAICDSLLPMSAALWVIGNSDDKTDPHWRYFGLISLPICGVILCYLLVRAFGEFRKIRQLEQRSIAE